MIRMILAIAFSIILADGPVYMTVPVLPVPEVERVPLLTYDAFTPSGIDAAGFDRLLARSALDGCGSAFADLEASFGINGLFALAVCHLESGLGESRAGHNNLFGFYAQDGYMQFSSAQRCIQYFGELMQHEWYRGKSLDQIAAVYCPSNDHWATDVQWLMAHHFEQGGFEQ